MEEKVGRSVWWQWWWRRQSRGRWPWQRGHLGEEVRIFGAFVEPKNEVSLFLLAHTWVSINPAEQRSSKQEEKTSKKWAGVFLFGLGERESN